MFVVSGGGGGREDLWGISNVVRWLVGGGGDVCFFCGGGGVGGFFCFFVFLSVDVAQQFVSSGFFLRIVFPLVVSIFGCQQLVGEGTSRFPCDTIG